jgi:RNA polymerase sigma factor (sigma-70 family)
MENQIMSTETDGGAAPPVPAGSPAVTGNHTMGGAAAVADLIARAMNGDERAWRALVERYASLIWSICRKYRLSETDAEDVGQSVWLLLVDQLDKIRDPAALPGWLATTTRRKCALVVSAAQGPLVSQYVLNAEILPDEHAETAEQILLTAERHAVLREAFADLPPFGQRLIAMLIADPPIPYTEISARLGIPVGSIGPTRARYLDRLRRHPAIAALINADSSAADGGNRVEVDHYLAFDGGLGTKGKSWSPPLLTTP